MSETNAFREELPYSTFRNPQNHSAEKIWDKIKKVYTDNGMTEYLEPLKQMINAVGKIKID